MVATSTSNKVPDNYDRKSEVKAFDETKEGVKGLVDAGMTQVPRIFHQPPKPGDQYCISSSTSDSEASQFSIPVIDLEEMYGYFAPAFSGITVIASSAFQSPFLEVQQNQSPFVLPLPFLE